MKVFLNLSGLYLIIFITVLQISISSCTKEVITDTIIKNDTLTLVKNDTIVIKDTVLSIEILTASGWMLQEYRGVEGNLLEYYERGGSNNLQNFDNEYIVFRSDKTGIYYDPAALPSPLTWDFINLEHTKLNFTVSFPQPAGPTLVHWENIIYKNNSLKIDQYWTQNNTNNHSQLIRIPKIK